MKRRKREQAVESMVFNTDSYSVSRLHSTEGAMEYICHSDYAFELEIIVKFTTGIAKGRENRVKA